MQPPRIGSFFHRRPALIAGAVAVLGVWGLSATPLIESLKNPYADGFDAIPFFYASLTLLPLGLSVLAGAMSRRDSSRERARQHLLICVALLAFALLFKGFLWFANKYLQGVI
jgi:hypothetical protein